MRERDTASFQTILVPRKHSTSLAVHLIGTSGRSLTKLKCKQDEMAPTRVFQRCTRLSDSFAQTL